jgi:hypothetical protein
LAAKTEKYKEAKFNFDSLSGKVESLQESLSESQEEVLMLRELNRVLRIRIDNDMSDFSEDESGSIVRRKRMPKKVIVKSPSDITADVKTDPALQHVA